MIAKKGTLVRALNANITAKDSQYVKKIKKKMCLII